MWFQKQLQLQPHTRGFHLITDDICRQLPEVATLKVGLLHVFIQHSSASITLNENADPTVRDDFESYFNKTVPENEPYYTHTLEGPDDLPAHLKASLLGASLSIPISEGRLALGIWQGIYLCEHRDHAAARHLVLTVHGE